MKRKILLPILDPRFNLKSIVGELILLEHHLAERSQRCYDCQAKHLLTIEALASEGVYLDKKGTLLKDFTEIGETIRKIQRQFVRTNAKFPKVGEARDQAFRRIAQRVRRMRKRFMRPAIEFSLKE